MSEPSPRIQTLELIDIVQEVESVINHFDQLTEPFKNRHVWKLLYQIREKLREVEQLPMPLLGDMLAYEVNTVSVNGTERENHGLEQHLNPTVMEHWEQRARSLTNPLLKVTYADARWYFSPLNGARASVDMAYIVIDACFEILETKRYPDPIDARWYAQRAFDLAAKLNDPVRKLKAIETIIKTEDEISVDNKPGLWGFAFDCLMTGSRVQLDEPTTSKLIQDLEGRLERLTQPAILHLSATEKALSRLVSYYKRMNRLEDAQKHISTYAEAVLLFADKNDESALTRQHRILELRELYLQNGMRDEAHALESKIHELGEISTGEMQTFSVPFEITKEEMDEYVATYICETLEISLTRIAARYLIPSREDTEREVRKQAEEFPMSYLFPQIIVDSDGRWVARTSGIDDHVGPYLSQHATRSMIVSAVFLRKVITGVLSHFDAKADDIMEYLMKSPAFKPDKEGLIRTGLDAYLRDDYVTATHLWVPQIEEGIRQLAKGIGIEVLKIDPHTHGYNYRDLGNLLDDSKLEQAFGIIGSRLIFYLNIVMNDKFGWNVRNDLCHGLISDDGFTDVITDRLFHILLLLALFRHPQQETIDRDPLP
ncbi:MAG TPA: DUF4209 domain-containing protein [Coleofasciculaceae cyanobacterium]|jgi:hypothetical protein